jgi:hypothetical protein
MTMFKQYALPIIKKEGTKYLHKQAAGFMGGGSGGGRR